MEDWAGRELSTGRHLCWWEQLLFVWNLSVPQPVLCQVRDVWWVIHGYHMSNIICNYHIIITHITWNLSVPQPVLCQVRDVWYVILSCTEWYSNIKLSLSYKLYCFIVVNQTKIVELHLVTLAMSCVEYVFTWSNHLLNGTLTGISLASFNLSKMQLSYYHQHMRIWSLSLPQPILSCQVKKCVVNGSFRASASLKILEKLVHF